MKKKTLLSSVVAIVLCLSLMTGASFALFTSESKVSVAVTSATVSVTATVDETSLKLYSMDELMTDTFANGGTASYDANTATVMLENVTPGDKVAFTIDVNNASNVAIKYRVATLISGELAPFLTAKATINQVEAEIKDGVTAWTDAAVGDTIGDIPVSIELPQGVGDEAQEKSAAITVTVQAVQANGADKYATTVGTNEELMAALRIGGSVKFVNDISVEETITIPAGVTVDLDLNGKTITGTKGRDADNNRIHVLVNNGILTINNGIVKSAGNDGGSAIYNNEGAKLTINNVTLYGAPQSDPVYEAGVSKPFPSYALNNYGDVVVNGATVKSYHGAIATGGNGTTIINDADIDVGLGQSTGITSYAIYSYEDAQVTVNGGKFAFTKQEIYVNGGNTFCELGTNPIIINGGNYIGTSFSSGAGREYVINGGTFDKDPSAYAMGQVVNNNDGTWTVKPYEVSTAADLKTKLANGNPVVLTADVSFDTKLTIEKDAYIDGNGKTISFTSGSADRFIDVPKTSNGANLTIKNVTIDIGGTYCQRGINYNTNGTMVLDNVKLTGNTKATYGINLPSSSKNAIVEMVNCDITALIALNVWGENAVVNVVDCNLSNYDNNATEGENYSTVVLNNDGTNAAEGAVITITGGSITAKDETGALSVAISNNTATGAIVISDSTVVDGMTATNKAIVRFKDGNGNFYNEFYGAASLQGAITLAVKSANSEVFLLTDITVDTLDVPANIIVHKNGHNLTIGATTGTGTLNIVD